MHFFYGSFAAVEKAGDGKKGLERMVRKYAEKTFRVEFYYLYLHFFFSKFYSF